MNKEQEEKFDKLLPCVMSGCSNDGIIPEQDGEGDWQPSQCEYCYKVRFPVKDFINKLLKEEREEIQGDIETVITLLEANEDRNKVVNFIKKYLKN